METIAVTDTKQEIADWIESLSERDARMLELYSIELKDQVAIEFINQVENSPWFKTMQKDFDLVDKVYNGFFKLLESIGITSLFFINK